MITSFHHLHFPASEGPRRKTRPGLTPAVITVLFLTAGMLFPGTPAGAQNLPSRADSLPVYSLDRCLSYALRHQPGLNQSIVNREIVRTTNAINLSGWMPQLSITGNLLHYNQLPTTLTPNTANPSGPPVPAHTGVYNTAIPEFTASETIFSPQLFYAASSAPLTAELADQATDSAKISLIVNVSKAFYNLLLTLEQVNVLREDTARLGRNVVDTYHQYVGGIVDETDYQQAVITLNNSLGQLKQETENIAPAYAILKQTMGCPPEDQFSVTFDTTRMMEDIVCDTLEPVHYDRRIEYRQLMTEKSLQHRQTAADWLSLLPSVSVFYNYFYEYESNPASDLFKTAYPYSYVGLSFSLPLFTGFSRAETIARSRLEEENLDWAEANLRSEINTEYREALAGYKSNLYNWRLLQDNRARAQDVYRIVSLQYKQGVVSYINLIVAESNLITAESGYVNALFQLLSSKIDLEKATGDIPYNH